jgi:hypothetical protein
MGSLMAGCPTFLTQEEIQQLIDNALAERPADAPSPSGGEQGDQGATGEQGATGAAGAEGSAGQSGADGLSCWDLDDDGTTDPDEDINSDGDYNALDCQGMDGATGQDGISCWDLNGDGTGDAGEDVNNDGDFDSDDCQGPTGPSDPVIESLLITGSPAAPNGSITVEAFAQSAQNAILSYSWSVEPNTWVISNGGDTNTAMITAPSEYGALGTATVIVTDDGGRTATGAVALSTAVNLGPVIQSLSASPNPVWKNQTTIVTVEAVDPNGDAISYDWTAPDGFEIQSGQGTNQAILLSTQFSDGNVEVSVSDSAGESSTGSLFVRTKDGSWGVPHFLESNNNGADGDPRIALDPSGTGIVVWVQWDTVRNNVWANRYVPGSGWTGSELIETDNSGSTSNPQIAMDSTGNGIAVWSQSDGVRRNIWANHYVVGIGWSTAQLIETDNNGDANLPQIAVDPAGNGIAVWHQSDGVRANIWANRYTSGVGWSTAELLESDNSGNATLPQIGVDSSGNGIAVWEQSDGVRFNISASQFDPDTGWSTAEPIEIDNTGSAFIPQIAVDSSGNGIAVWGQSDGLRNNIWSNRFVAGTGWQSAELIESGDAGSAESPRIAVDPSGNGMAVWSQSDGTIFNIHANRYIAGEGWSSDQIIDTGNIGSTFFPRVALDSTGNGLVIWEQVTIIFSSTWSNRYKAGAGWTGALLLESDESGSAEDADLAVNPSGNAIAVWQQMIGTKQSVLANRFE